MKHSQKTKEQISKKLHGRKLTQDHRKNISLNNAKYHLGKPRSQECKNKISQTLKEKYAKGLLSLNGVKAMHKKNLGSYLSKEHKRKISDKLIGHIGPKYKHTNEAKEKMSLIHKGIKHTNETKQKMSKSHIGKKLSKEHKLNMSKSQINRIMKNNGINLVHNKFKKGKFYSNKNQNEIYYDSSWELQAYKILEQISLVKSYSRCKFSIDYKYEDSSIHKYIPDILVTYIDNRQEVVEIKPEYKLQELNTKLKIEALKNYCTNNNMGYGILTEKHLFKNKREWPFAYEGPGAIIIRDITI